MEGPRRCRELSLVERRRKSQSGLIQWLYATLMEDIAIC
jgi:hypothetical protein